MIDTTFYEKGGNRFDNFACIFASFVGPEVDKLGTCLALDEKKPSFENLKDSRGCLVGNDVNPDISGGLIDEDDEANSMAECFGCDWADVRLDTEEFDFGSLHDGGERFASLLSHNAFVAFARREIVAKKTHPFRRSMAETLMHELR